MLFRRIIICVVLVGLVVGPLESSKAAKKETNDDPGALGVLVVPLAGIATGAVFGFIYKQISGEKRPKNKLRRTTQDNNLLISGGFGQRAFIMGLDAEPFDAATPLGISVRYQTRDIVGLSTLGILVRSADHKGAGSAEGATFKMTKVALTVGSIKRSKKAIYEYDIGLGGVLREESDMYGSDKSGAFLANYGNSLEFRIGERLSIGPRIEFSYIRWSSDGEYVPNEHHMVAVEGLLQCTVRLF